MRQHARNHGGVPIFNLKSRVPHLEPPSEKCKEIANKQTAKRALPEHSKKQLTGIKRARGDIDEEMEPSKKKRKGPKEPNPLSCLKKKKKSETLAQNGNGKKSRKRRRGKGNDNSEDLMKLIKKVTSEG